MQQFIVKVLFLSGWALAFIHATDIDIKKHLTWHSFFRIRAAEYNVPGFKIVEVDRDVSNSSWLAKISRDSGYRLRALLNQWPQFLFAESSPKSPHKRNLIMRSEVALEFQGNNSYNFLRLQAARVGGFAEQFSKPFGFRSVVMIIPTKIFANDVEVQVSQSYSWALKWLDIDDGSKLVGSKFFQILVEEWLRTEGAEVVSLIPLYDRLKKNSPEPLYPYGESHWSKWTIEEAGQYLVSELARKKIIPHSCFEPVKDWPELKEKVYFGDLYQASKLPEDKESPYATRSHESRIAQLPAASDLPQCPALLYAGTSYGTPTYDGDIAQMIKRVYHGPVRNYSVPAKGPFASLKGLEKDHGSWPAKSILVWEFPFHHILGPDILMGPQ